MQYDPLARTRVVSLFAYTEKDLNMSGLDERVKFAIKLILAQQQTLFGVTPTKLKIKLREATALIFRKIKN